MKETLVEVVVAGTYLLSPHAVEQPAAIEPASILETVAVNESLTSAQLTQPESNGTILIDSELVKAAMSTLPERSGRAQQPHSGNQHNVAILESLDPGTLEFWLEAGASGVGLGGISTFIANRRLKRSLRRNHTTIKNEGWEAQAQLDAVLKAAKQQASVLRDDDVLKLRRLIENHGVSSAGLLNALAHTDSEFDAERGRFFALKRRLRRAPHTKFIVDATEAAAKQTVELQRELDTVQKDFTEINVNIDSAESAVLGLRGDLDALTEKGWDVSAYDERVTKLADAVATAQTKRDEKYIEKPTEIAKAATAAALKLQAEARGLEARRTAADEVYGTQSDRLDAAKAIAGEIRECFAELQGTYNEACLVDFEDLPDDLAQALAALKSTHKDGGILIGGQGKSVDAVARSEELNTSFDETIEEIQSMKTDLLEHQERLETLAEELPRKVRELRIRFDQAMDLANDPDVEDDATAEIQSLTADVFSLSASIKMKKGRKPDYLDIEQRHTDLAEVVAQVYNVAKKQKQEMNDLRTSIPPLKDEYNSLVRVIKGFAQQSAGQSKVRLKTKTVGHVARLQPYNYDMAPDRKNLRLQKKQLKELIGDARWIMRRVEKEL